MAPSLAWPMRRWPAWSGTPFTVTAPSWRRTSISWASTDQRTSNVVPTTAMTKGPASTDQRAPGLWAMWKEAVPPSRRMRAPRGPTSATRPPAPAAKEATLPSLKRRVAPAGT